MSKNIVIALGIVLLLVIVGAIVATKMTEKPAVTASPSVSSSPIAVASIEVSTPKTIVYTDAGYEPSEMTIKKGDTITWENSSSKDMWPASAMHPTHKVYPDQNSCFAGLYEDCKVAPGKTYSLVFNQVGTWGVHDHLTPTKFGKVIVTE